MGFSGNETELTAAGSDLLLALIGVAGVLLIRRPGARREEAQRRRVWGWAFGLLGAAGALGAAAHGLETGETAGYLLWQALYLALGWTVSLFAAGVLIDLGCTPLPRRVIGGLLGAGGVFWGATLLFSGSFIVFLLYEAAALLFALGAYLHLRRREHEPYSLWMAGGIAVSIAAAAIQSSGLSLRIGLKFDHNGLFHLVQAIGAGMLVQGARLPRGRTTGRSIPGPGPDGR